jgi:hypothetical protein
MTQQEILRHFLTNDWKPSWELIMKQTPFGWLGSSADRQARFLAENGEIERKRQGKYAYYRRKQLENKLF